MKYSVKKVNREYTPLESFAHLISILEKRGDRIAFKYAVGKSFETITYASFAHMATEVAAGLNQIGLAGERIGIIGDTSPEWVASYLGIIAAGGVAIPLDKELAISELEGFLSGVDARAIIYSAQFNEKFAETKNTHATLKTFIPISGEADEKTTPFANLLAAGTAAIEQGYTLPERDHDALATMLFTSGTTGTSKCVMLAEKNTCFNNFFKACFYLVFIT